MVYARWCMRDVDCLHVLGGKDLCHELVPMALAVPAVHILTQPSQHVVCCVGCTYDYPGLAHRLEKKKTLVCCVASLLTLYQGCINLL